MRLQALNALVVILFRRVRLDFLIYYFNLTVGPRVPEFGQLVLAPVSGAGLVKHVGFGFGPQMFGQQGIGELRAIIHCPAVVCLQTMRGGEDCMDFERAIRR